MPNDDITTKSVHSLTMRIGPRCTRVVGNVQLAQLSVAHVWHHLIPTFLEPQQLVDRHQPVQSRGVTFNVPLNTGTVITVDKNLIGDVLELVKPLVGRVNLIFEALQARGVFIMAADAKAVQVVAKNNQVVWLPGLGYVVYYLACALILERVMTIRDE